MTIIMTVIVLQCAAETVKAAIAEDEGSRALVVCLKDEEARWRRALGSQVARVTRVMSLGGADSIGGAAASDLLVGAREAVALAVGERRCPDQRGRVDYERVSCLMDPLDSGESKMPARWKQATSFSSVYPELKASDWKDKGFPPHIMRMVEEGAEITPFEVEGPQGLDGGRELADPKSSEPLGPGRVVDEHGVVHTFRVEDGQYAYPDREHFEQGVAECDRAMLVGHLEPVPAEMVDAALATAPAHPWNTSVAAF